MTVSLLSDSSTKSSAYEAKALPTVPARRLWTLLNVGEGFKLTEIGSYGH